MIKLFVKEDYYDDEDSYTDSEGYYTEDWADYLECHITMTMYTFTEPVSKIRQYIIEDVCRSRDCDKISLNTYKHYAQNRELVDVEGTPYNLDGQEVIDLVVRFCVDANGEYDFIEYAMDESITEVKRYLS